MFITMFIICILPSGCPGGYVEISFKYQYYYYYVIRLFIHLVHFVICALILSFVVVLMVMVVYFRPVWGVYSLLAGLVMVNCVLTFWLYWIKRWFFTTGWPVG